MTCSLATSMDRIAHRVLRLVSGRVSHLWFGLEFGKFQLKTSNFSIFFPSGQKKSLRVGKYPGQSGSASYLLRVKSKLGSGQGPSLVTCLGFD